MSNSKKNMIVPYNNITKICKLIKKYSYDVKKMLSH